jgi:hypothetical protein
VGEFVSIPAEGQYAERGVPQRFWQDTALVAHLLQLGAEAGDLGA